MHSIETLRVAFKTDHRPDVAYYIFDGGIPKTRVVIWARGELQPIITQAEYDAMLGVDPDIEAYESYYDPNDLYLHITSNHPWIHPTRLEVLVVTGLTSTKCKEILWETPNGTEDNLIEV